VVSRAEPRKIFASLVQEFLGACESLTVARLVYRAVALARMVCRVASALCAALLLYWPPPSAVPGAQIHFPVTNARQGHGRVRQVDHG
jgi:hypothetical protein